MYRDTPLTKRNITDVAKEYCAQYRFAVRVEFARDLAEEGYFDRTAGKIVVGRASWELPDWAGYYIVLRLLALAHQVLRPADFDRAICRSKDYRISPDGKCAKWTPDGWKTVDMQAVWPQTPDYWRAASENMPHLLAAADIAAEEAHDLLTHDCARDNLHNLHYMASPKRPFDRREYDGLFDRIDAEIARMGKLST